MVLGIGSGTGKWYSFRLERSTFGLITWVNSKTCLFLLVIGCVWFGFWLWLFSSKSQKSNQRARSRKQLFLKADFLAVQN
jgi:hypothetical protein